jgi:hypothetical protein
MKKEGIKMEKIKNTCKAVLIKMTLQEMDGWPPVCFGTFHQPKRPIHLLTKCVDQDKQKLK